RLTGTDPAKNGYRRGERTILCGSEVRIEFRAAAVGCPPCPGGGGCPPGGGGWWLWLVSCLRFGWSACGAAAAVWAGAGCGCGVVGVDTHGGPDVGVVFVSEGGAGSAGGECVRQVGVHFL